MVVAVQAYQHQPDLKRTERLPLLTVHAPSTVKNRVRAMYNQHSRAHERYKYQVSRTATYTGVFTDRMDTFGF